MVTTHITRRLNSVAGKSFSPLGGGAGERRPSCSHYPKPRGMSFNPLGGGAGSGTRSARQFDTSDCGRRDGNLVSIPSEVGRGRALINSAVGHRQIRRLRFNPLGGGAGSGSHVSGRCSSATFNPLGGGAGSGTCRRPLRRCLFQSPRRWGGVGLEFIWQALLNASLLRFNPLGGGAGSGSIQRIVQLDARAGLGFNPLGGGAGSGSQVSDSSSAAKRVSIPSEVGRGRAPQHMQQAPWSKAHPRVSIPSEVGRGRAGPSGKPCSTPSCLFQSPRRWGGVGLQSAKTLHAIADC